MKNRTIQPLKFGDETIYIEVSEVEQEGETQKDGFEEFSAIDRVKDAENKSKVRSVA